MNREILWCVLLAAVSAQAQRETHIVENGQSDYQIYVDAGAIASEKTAAERLQFYLEKVTGCRLEIVDKLPPEPAKVILVGPSATAVDRLGDVDWESLGHDGVVIRALDDDLVLAGGRPRGTLYAVYSFLEDIVGCRWWSSNESTIPRQPTLTIKDLDITYSPKLSCRDILYADIFKNPEFLVSLRLNGTFMGLPEELGGCVSILGWCHTFYPFLPPGTYFAEHPEWYSEINGKRTTHLSQLCLTNDEMRQEMTRVVLAKLRENPLVEVVSISQNDSPDGRCQCAACRALEAAEGAPSGPLLAFVNAIAADVEKEFPEVMVETLAYQYTRVPPKHLRPRKNVIIRLCAGMGCCYDKPLGSAYNAGFRDTFQQWAERCSNLYAWDYVANFSDTMVPHPNLRTLAPNIRFLVENHAIGIFEEGDHWSTMGDFVRLRAWLLGHLLWRPDADEEALTREFMEGYYGDAGGFLMQYLDLVHDALEREDIRLTSSGSDVAYMSLDDMNRAARLFDAAESAVAGNPERLGRVRRERVPLTYLWVLRYPDLRKMAAVTKQDFLGPMDPLAVCEQMYAIAEKDGSNYRDGDPMTAFFSRLKQRIPLMMRQATDTPDVCRGRDPDQWLDIQNGRFFLQCDGQNVADESASDGSAATMGGGHGDWSILCPVSTDWIRMFPETRCHVYAVVRCDVIKRAGTHAFTMGIFDYASFKDVICTRVPMEQVADGTYHTYDLGVHALDSNYGLYFAPSSNPEGIKSIFVDRIMILPEQDGM